MRTFIHLDHIVTLKIGQSLLIAAYQYRDFSITPRLFHNGTQQTEKVKFLPGEGVEFGMRPESDPILIQYSGTFQFFLGVFDDRVLELTCKTDVRNITCMFKKL
jgi:hypothetical protein